MNIGRTDGFSDRFYCSEDTLCNVNDAMVSYLVDAIAADNKSTAINNNGHFARVNISDV